VKSKTTDLVQVRNSVLICTGVAWALLIAAPTQMLAHCVAMDHAPDSASLSMVMAMNSPASLAAGWSLMLFAMMLPVLILPIGYIRSSSFASRRARSTALFLIGYFALWIVAGPVLLALAAALRRYAPQSWLPAIAVLTVALLWQSSPWKQICLNRCHLHIGLSAFGFSADLSALRFGLVHALWCVGSCWAWMLFPLLLPHGHIIAMVLVAGLAFAERIESPALPRWQPRGLGRVTRIVLTRLAQHLNGRLLPTE
jgi:predicted metal-binding membrane protein